MSIHHLRQFAQVPALIAPQAVRDVHALAEAPPRDEASTVAAGELCAAGLSGSAGGGGGKPFPFAGGIAVIPVWGVLLHRDRYCDGWATGYNYIHSAFSSALADEEVKAIVFDINSGGGHVAGCWDISDLIFEARGRKPTLSLVDARACSAAYAIGSAADRMIATDESCVGSIGVLMMHTSYEKMLEQAGIEVTFIYAGKHKVDGNPYQDLPEDVRAALTASVEKTYEKFVSRVARNRGIDPEAVRNTEARVYDAEDAKTIGLIDDVMAPRDAFASFLSEVNSASTLTQEAKTMSDQNNGTGGSNAPDENTLRAEAATAEQNRIAGIINSDEAKGRESLANHFAFNTRMSADDAKAALAAAPKREEKAEAAAPAAPGTSALAAAMAATGGGANVLPEGGDEEEQKGASGGLLKAAADLGYVQNKTH